MAYIRTYDTQRKRKGKTVRVYRVCWREPERDSFGLPTGKVVARQEGGGLRPPQIRPATVGFAAVSRRGGCRCYDFSAVAVEHQLLQRTRVQDGVGARVRPDVRRPQECVTAARTH